MPLDGATRLFRQTHALAEDPGLCEHERLPQAVPVKAVGTLFNHFPTPAHLPETLVSVGTV